MRPMPSNWNLIFLRSFRMFLGQMKSRRWSHCQTWKQNIFRFRRHICFHASTRASKIFAMLRQSCAPKVDASQQASSSISRQRAPKCKRMQKRAATGRRSSMPVRLRCRQDAERASDLDADLSAKVKLQSVRRIETSKEEWEIQTRRSISHHQLLLRRALLRDSFVLRKSFRINLLGLRFVAPKVSCARRAPWKSLRDFPPASMDECCCWIRTISIPMGFMLESTHITTISRQSRWRR